MTHAVSPELAHPFKVGFSRDALCGQLSGHIPGMNVHHNEGTQGLPLQLAQLPSHLVYHLCICSGHNAVKAEKEEVFMLLGSTTRASLPRSGLQVLSVTS